MGNLSVLLTWLRENVHRHGSRYPARELCERVTGRPLSHWPSVDYLDAKLEGIYDF